MEINEQNYLELFKPAILNEQIFNLKEAYLLEDVCLYACADVEDLEQELKILQPFHVFVKDGEIWISKNVKCELSIQGFPLWTITKDKEIVEGFHMEDIRFEVPLTPLGEKCLAESKNNPDKSFAEIVQETLGE